MKTWGLYIAIALVFFIYTSATKVDRDSSGAIVGEGNVDAFVGRNYESSSLDIMTLFPTTESWAQNDREVICAVYDINAIKLVGSAKGQQL